MCVHNEQISMGLYLVMLASRSTPSALEQEDSAIQTQIFFRSETQETFF